MAKAVPVDLEDGTKPYVQLGLSKRSGSKQCLAMFRLEGGEHDGITLPWFGYFTPESAERTIQSLRLMGWKGKKLASLATEKLDGRVQVTVENEPFEGKTRSRVSWVNDPAGPSLKMDKTMDDKTLAALEKSIGEYL